jgi:periplasmic protein TonB
MSQRSPRSSTGHYHGYEVAIEDKVFNLLFLTMLLVGAVVSQYLQHVRVQRPVYIPRPGPIKVTEVILREPEAPKPLPPAVEEKVTSVPATGTEPKLSKEEIRKRRTSPPPLSAVGSPKNLPAGEGGSVQKMVARKGLLGLLSKAETDPDLRAYQPSKKKDVSDELNKALKNLSGPGGQKGTGEEDDFLGVGNLPQVAKKGTDIGYILNASKIGEVKETQVEFYGGTEALPERVEKLPEEPKSQDGISVEGKPGGRTYSQIRKIVASYLGGLRYLYNKELRTNPALKGKITVAFEISPEGVVTQSLLVGSSLDSRPFEQMVLENVRKWKFPSIPEQNGNVKVTYPFVFLPPSS